MEKELDFKFNEDDIKKDIEKAKRKRTGDLKELEATFHEHNDGKPYACRCEDCVKYRKIYFNS